MYKSFLVAALLIISLPLIQIKSNEGLLFTAETLVQILLCTALLYILHGYNQAFLYLFDSFQYRLFAGTKV